MPSVGGNRQDGQRSNSPLHSQAAPTLLTASGKHISPVTTPAPSSSCPLPCQRGCQEPMAERGRPLVMKEPSVLGL